MKRTAILILIIANAMLMNVSAFAASENTCANPTIDREIRQGAVSWKNGYNDGEAAKVADLYTEDATYLTQHFVTGIVQGRPKIQAYVQRGVDAKYHIDSIEVLSTGCSGKMAYAITRYESTNGGQKAFGVNILVLKKTGKKWLIVAHESAVPDPATAIQSLESPTHK
ncbi:MAG: nuclear transport factor 2 family protein [Acidobacteria bacterium]|nr:nuclear transport factor 2 family protein [Acidobacteriota bacterium]